MPLGPAQHEGEYAWLNSGDRAFQADGEIFITGRVKDIIIKGGRNLYPHEVEELAAGGWKGFARVAWWHLDLKDKSSGTEKTGDCGGGSRRRRFAKGCDHSGNQ